MKVVQIRSEAATRVADINQLCAIGICVIV